MAGGKFVQIDCYLEWPTGTPAMSQFHAVNLEALRAEVESSVFGNKVDQSVKGTHKHTFTVKVRPDADFAFVKVLIGQMESDADFAVLYRPKNAAKSSTNPEMTFNVMLSKLPPLGGERGKLLEGDMQCHVNSSISYDDGTTPIIIGG